jgi:hypothetical protein
MRFRASRKSCRREMQDLPESPPGVYGEHDEQPGGQEQKDVVEESLPEGDWLAGGERAKTISHVDAPSVGSVSSDRGHDTSAAEGAV